MDTILSLYMANKGLIVGAMYGSLSTLEVIPDAEQGISSGCGPKKKKTREKETVQ